MTTATRAVSRRHRRIPVAAPGARLAQGLGGAMMLPAALSILTTTFEDGTGRRKALGAWGAVVGLASVGPLLGGLLVQGPGWRWAFFVFPPICVPVLGATVWLIGGEPHRAGLPHLDLPAAVLATPRAPPLPLSPLPP